MCSLFVCVCISYDKLNNVSCRICYPEADIESCSVKQLFGKIKSKSLQFLKNSELLSVQSINVGPSKKLCFICLNESPSKIMKNAFYFIYKTLFVLKISLKFLFLS